MTIHVTPEPEFSYVSFETNAHHNQGSLSYIDLVLRVVTTFQPDKFILTIFSHMVKLKVLANLIMSYLEVL